jgi:hypothetical protein
MRTLKKTRLERVIGVEAVPDLQEWHRRRTFRFASRYSRTEISDWFSLVHQTCHGKQNLLFTLERYNLSRVRREFQDIIVDLCISLESMLNGTSELKNRLSLSMAFVTETDPSHRLAAFQRISDLYDARSSIVHGEVNQKYVDKVQSNWELTQKVATAAISYYLAYMQNHSRQEWEIHLKHLVLGVDKRIVD